jgi:hypothetical protein
MTDFVNLKIKSTQSFKDAHRGMMCVRVFIEVSTHTCISIYICNVFLKKNLNHFPNQIQMELCSIRHHDGQMTMGRGCS